MSKIYAVGIGPGGQEYMTQEAFQVLDGVDVIAGYTVYVDLVRDRYPDKEFYTTPMKKEIERCRWAIERAREGSSVAMICSGDAGVYGMAGLLFELAQQYEDVDVVVVPGITAAISGAAVLGAPIGHDFCLISLSDLLTPWSLIETRLRCAAEGDFAICIYNPRSKKRDDYLRKACDILLQYRPADNVCGWVRNIGREGEEYRVLPLSELGDEPIDMFTTVFIGSTRTRVMNGRMITPRGYEQHEDTYFRRNDGE
ncbi:MAG: precorrin-3B C(17)-methyltransferase [Firmicutes bacterium]|nr:precorrin-3B C(17)-methyltransferase [Bacillota bacterium]